MSAKIITIDQIVKLLTCLAITVSRRLKKYLDKNENEYESRYQTVLIQKNRYTFN